MEGLAKTLAILIVLIIPTVLTNDNKDKETVKDSKYHVTGKIFQNPQSTSITGYHIDVIGKGIQDTFNVPEDLIEHFTLKVITTENLLIIGDVEKDKYLIFSNKKANIVVYKSGECKSRSYVTKKDPTSKEWVTTFTKSKLTTKECGKLKEKMTKLAKNNSNWAKIKEFVLDKMGAFTKKS